MTGQVDDPVLEQIDDCDICLLIKSGLNPIFIEDIRRTPWASQEPSTLSPLRLHGLSVEIKAETRKLQSQGADWMTPRRTTPRPRWTTSKARLPRPHQPQPESKRANRLQKRHLPQSSIAHQGATPDHRQQLRPWWVLRHHRFRQVRLRRWPSASSSSRPKTIDQRLTHHERPCSSSRTYRRCSDVMATAITGATHPLWQHHRDHAQRHNGHESASTPRAHHRRSRRFGPLIRHATTHHEKRQKRVRQSWWQPS